MPETKLKKLIDEKGIKQRFIAKKANIDESSISKYVRGTLRPSYNTAEKIAKVLECKPDDIFFEN